MRVFLVAFNAALAIVVIAWLHSPPLGYQWPKQQAEHNASAPEKSDQDEAAAKSTSPIINGVPAQDLKRKHSTDTAASNKQPENGWWDKLRNDPNAAFAGAVSTPE